MFRSLSRASLLATVVLFAAGCGSSEPKPVELQGKLVLPAKLKLLESDSINITFSPDGGGKGSGSATMTGKESSFTAQVPPGKYKVSVNIQGYPGEKGSEAHNREISQSVGMYDPSSSSLRYEVTDGSQAITIDLAKGTVSKN